jgi:hypothetical protein
MSENRLALIVRESGLESTKANFILTQFQDYFNIAADWEVKAKTIVVTDESQKAEMQMARVGRLFLKEKRVAIEKARKELKEQALREGKAIDGIANVLKALIVPIEEYLDKQERFVEIRAEEAEKKRLADEAAQVEAERLAREEAERVERERIRLENEKLKAEAVERERVMAEERAKAEAERLAVEERAAAEKRAIEEKAAAERRIADEEKRKAQTEINRLNREAEAEREKREKAKLNIPKRIVLCPFCQKEFEVPNERTE